MRESLLSFLVLIGGAVLTAAQDRLPRQAPLTSLGGIGKVVVVSSHNELDVPQLRKELEEKLRRHGVLPAWASGSRAAELYLYIGRHQGTSVHSRCKHYTYLLTLQLREPIVLERDPTTVVFGVTWETSSWTNRFNTDIPAQSIADSAHNLLNTFLGTYLSELDGNDVRMQNPQDEE